MALLPNPSNIPFLPEVGGDPRQDTNEGLSAASVQIDEVRNSVPDPSDFATTAYVLAAFASIVGMAPSTLDTIFELAAAMEDEQNATTALLISLAGKQPANVNLAAISLLATTAFGRDFLALADEAAARTKLELGNAATKDTGTGSGNVAAGDHVHSILSPGYLVMPDLPGVASSSAAISANDAVNCVRVVLRQKLTVVSTHARVVAGAASGAVSWGIYDSAGTTKVVDSGIQTATAAGTKNIALGSPVALEPGSYWLAWTSNNTAITMTAVNLTTLSSIIGFGTTIHLGTAANAGTAGALPSTLGTVTTASVNIPLVRLQA